MAADKLARLRAAIRRARLPALFEAPAAYEERFVETIASAYLNRTPWTKLRLAAIRDLVEPRPGDRIVDLGCAAGAITHFLSAHGCHVVGVDSAPLAIQRARTLFPDLSFVLADAACLPLDDGSFAKAVAADFTEHVDDPDFRRILAETRRVLRPGGTLSIYTPNPLHLVERLKERNLLLAQNPTHIGLRTAPHLKRVLLDAGYEIERDEWVSSFIPGLRLVERIAAPTLELFRFATAFASVRGRLRDRAFAAASPGIVG